MPNILKSVLVRRFLAHSLEISVTFALSLITLSIINYVVSITNIKFGFYDLGLVTQITDSAKNNIPMVETPEQSHYNNVVSYISGLVVLFTLYYFVFTAFNFFFTFTILYPRNDYKVSIAYRLFGFSHFDFGKKKLSHFKKAMKIIYREGVLALTIYGIFFLLTILNIKIVVRFMSNFMGYGNTFLDLLLTVFYLFCIFVLPALILSLITLKRTKGKQLFWDSISGVTMK